MNALTEFLGQNGLMLLTGSSLLLALASVGLCFQRSPIQCQRFGELALVCVLAWVALACVPLPRFSVAEFITASPPAPESDARRLPDSFEQAESGKRIVPQEFGSRQEPRDGGATGEVTIEPAPLPAIVAPEKPESPLASPVPARRAEPAVSRTSSLIAGLYLVGCGVCAAWLLLGQALLVRVGASATSAEPWLQELYEALPWEAGRQRPLLVVTRGGRAMSWGAWRPMIALPLELCRPANATHLRQVLLHELGHIAQRDALGNLVFNLAFPLLYFHPLYWWLRSKVRFAGELIADDWAARHSTREAYVQALIALVRNSPRGLGLMGVLSASQSPTQFYRRMNMLLERETPLATHCPRWWRLIYVPLLVITAGLAIGLVGVQPAIGQASADDPDQGHAASGDKIGLDSLKDVDERSITRISATMPGKIEKLYKATGQRVKKGESLAELHSPVLFVATQELLVANRGGNNALMRACREKLQLLEMSDDQIEEVLKTDKPVSHLTIRAPLDGYVMANYANVKGAVVKSGDPLFDLVDLSAVALPKRRAAKPADKNDKVHALLNERLATLKQLSATTNADYATGKATLGEVTQVNAQLLAADLELCESDQERMAVHERAVELAKGYEKATVELYKAAQVTHSAVLAASANRLEAEIAYERAKARAGKKRD